jgi:hypothetical protein
MDERFIKGGLSHRLAHFVEEAGEALAAAGKTQRWGLESVNPLLPAAQQETNRIWLLRELRDVRSAVDLLVSEIASTPAQEPLAGYSPP